MGISKQGSEQQKSWEIDMMEEDDMDDDELVRVCAHSRGREGGRKGHVVDTDEAGEKNRTQQQQRRDIHLCASLPSCG